MAQLSEDCFAFGGRLMSVEEGAALVAERVAPVTETERVPLADADGRVLAEDVIAPVDLPPFDNSAVDGWAVRSADLPCGAKLRLRTAGRIAAGQGEAEPVAPGSAVRIFTGAPMPEGADTVFMQEDVRLEGDGVILPAGLKPGANRRLRGEDIAQGAPALPAGRRLRPQDIGLTAALGLPALTVRRRLRVAIFSTGDELTPPGRALGPAALYDSNRFMLAALLRRGGAEVQDLGIMRDEPAPLADALRGAAETADLVLTSGGVSTGEEDHVKAAVEAVGRLAFWRLAIKPGRPVAMGVIPGPRPGMGAAFAGLPGNPVAVFVTFVTVVRPLLARLSGETLTPLPRLPVRAAFVYRKKAGRREYVRVSLTPGGDGALEARKFPRDGAGVITSLTETSGLVELGEDVLSIGPGDSVGYLSYADLL